MKNSEDRRIWRECHALTLAIYRATMNLKPFDFVEIEELRSTAITLETRMESAFAAKTPAHRSKFIDMVMGSLTRLSGELVFCRDVKTLAPAVVNRLSADVETIYDRVWEGLSQRERDAREREWRWLEKVDKEVAASVYSPSQALRLPSGVRPTPRSRKREARSGQ